MKENEIDYKALYEETISRLKMAKKNIGCYTFSSVIDKVIPKLAESEGEGMRKRLLNWFKGCNWDAIDNGTLKRDDIIAWLEEYKEHKPIESKSTWSEDDESKFKFLHHLLEQYLEPHGSYSFSDIKELGYVTKQEALDMLKSLKDRMAWRPTEKQMKALGDAIFDAEYDHRLTEMNALLSLDKDLKNL